MFVFDCVIFDQRINAPVVGAEVVLSVQRSSNGGFNPNYETVASAITDANGSFYFEVDKEVFHSYRLQVSDEQHFNGTFEIDPDDVPISSAYEATFNLEPKAWVSVHLQNQDISQSVSVAIESESDNCADCCDGSTTTITGWPVNSTVTCQLYGGQTAVVNGTFTDINGGVHLISESGSAVPFDTLVFSVIY